jgi:hypothetical protein
MPNWVVLSVFALIVVGVCGLIVYIETRTLFDDLPDVGLVIWRILAGCLRFGLAGGAIYWLLLILRDPTHLGFAATPDAYQMLSAIGTLQLGRVDLDGRAYQRPGLGGSWYDKALHSHMVSIYRATLAKMDGGRQKMTVRMGLLAVYQPADLAAQFESWAETKESVESDTLLRYLDDTVSGRLRDAASKKKAMVSRLLKVDLDGALYVLSIRASEAVLKRAWEVRPATPGHSGRGKKSGGAR